MNAKTLLAAAIAALLISTAAPPVHAQSVSREASKAREQPAEQTSGKKKKKADDSAEGPSYSNATREDPGKGKAKLQSKLAKLNKQFQTDEFAAVIAGAEEILADPKAGPYDRAQAAYFASFAAVNLDEPTHATAIKYAKRAIEENALSNTIHYQLMQQLAQMHLVDEQYDQAIAVIDRYLAEIKESDPKAQAIRGNALYRLDRYAEAIEAFKLATPAGEEPERAVTSMLLDSYLQSERFADAIAMAEKMAAANPKDKKAQLNLATVYAQADQPAKAAAVFERLQTGGLLTEASDYETGYRLLASLDGREKDTIAFINAGLAKGVIKPSAQVYSLLGQSYYFTDDMAQAIAAWEKGAPLARDGEMYLNLAKANSQEERWAAAKAAAQQAIAKGVKKPGDAWIVIAGAEQALGNDAGVIAAYREAAKDPATRESAQRMLKSLGAK